MLSDVPTARSDEHNHLSRSPSTFGTNLAALIPSTGLRRSLAAIWVGQRAGEGATIGNVIEHLRRGLAVRAGSDPD
jgi:hypothetical protein